MVREKGKRILLTVKPALYDEIMKLSIEKGVSMSSIVNLSLQGGFIALKMSANPEYSDYFEKMMGDSKKGDR